MRALLIRRIAVSAGFAALDSVPVQSRNRTAVASRTRRGDPPGYHMKKYVIAGILLVLSAFLAWLVWIETKVLFITLGLLAICLVALYFVLKKM